MPIDLTTLLMEAAFDPTPISTNVFSVTVTAGPDVGASIRLDGSSARALVGTSEACDLRLSDRAVSRRHAGFDVVDARLRIVDLSSRNGTFVNGVAVVDAYVGGGESVQLGATTLRVAVISNDHEVSLPTTTEFGDYIGASTEMRRLYPLIERIAATNLPTLIEGETGTGKEVLAEAIHDRGPRAQGPFVVFDCTAVPPSLIEAELFGHEKGAFTGASAAHPGVVEQAHGGTLFIDEIGDLEPSMQPKLLRILDRQEIRRIGGHASIRVDVRILAATRRNLEEEVAAGRFRDDLFHRLVIGRVLLPPLRHRKGDVTVLARAFAEQLGAPSGSIPPDVLARWEAHPWPGNIRELRGAVSRFLALGQLTPVTSETHPPPSSRDVIDQLLAQHLTLPEARRRLTAIFERRYVEHALQRSGGNVSKAAEASGIARRHFQTLKSKPLGALGDE